MAYFYKRPKKDGGWTWYYGFKDVDGVDKQVSAGTHVKSEAILKAKTTEGRVLKGLPGIPPADESAKIKELMAEWLETLTNRNKKDDKQRAEKHLFPAFGDKRAADVTTDKVIRWLDKLRAEGELSDASVRHLMHLLSRFFAYAVPRKLAAYNPVSGIPRGARPRETPKRDIAWLDDETLTREAFNALPVPINLMFYLGNRSGLRTGEICGLRLSDFEEMEKGVLRVRYSYNGPLKEDKNGNKVKYAPLPFEASTVLGAWLQKRKDAGAQPESLVFPNPHIKGEKGEQCFQKKHMGEIWRKAVKPLGLTFTWYQATRHSFVSRSLSQGASLDEVSASVGHSSPGVTKRYYDHLVRKEFSPLLRGGMGLDTGAPGEVVPLPGGQGSREVAGKKA